MEILKKVENIFTISFLCVCLIFIFSFTILVFAGSVDSFGTSESPSIVEWTPDENTPELVYYQCWTHIKLGWRIYVVDAGKSDSFVALPGTATICPSQSTIQTTTIETTTIKTSQTTTTPTNVQSTTATLDVTNGTTQEKEEDSNQEEEEEESNQESNQEAEEEEFMVDDSDSSQSLQLTTLMMLMLIVFNLLN